jgi:hypothetical protein
MKRTTKAATGRTRRPSMGGIHFRTADMQGAVLGKKVAHYVEKHYFQPVH